MTIRVTIKNADEGENRIISAQAVYPATPEHNGPAKELKGGESTDLYVHSTAEIVVKEVRNG